MSQDPQLVASVIEAAKEKFAADHAASFLFASPTPSSVLDQADAFLQKIIPALGPLIPGNYGLYVDFAVKALHALNSVVNPPVAS